MAGRSNASQDAGDATPTDQRQGAFLLMTMGDQRREPVKDKVRSEFGDSLPD